MTSSPYAKWLRSPLLAFALLLGVVLTGKGESPCPGCAPRCLEELRDLSPCELALLYAQADVGHPFVGRARGRLLFLTDRRLPRLKVQAANAVWRGKAAEYDGHFINRWLGGLQAIGSHYTYGPSWFDGKPCLIMEYAPGTPLFANMHDELREIAPGLYLGPVYERFPCPKLRGFIGLQLEPCKPHGR